MQRDYIEAVYSTLAGVLENDACVPGVHSIFEDGMLCDKLYADMSRAYERLRERLGVVDEDKDAEIIINSLLSIGLEMGVHMYYYGAKFGKVQ